MNNWHKFDQSLEAAGYWSPRKNYTFTELRNLLGGSTKAASSELGVSARQGARYLSYEGDRKSQWRSTKKVQGKINEAVRKLLKPDKNVRVNISGNFEKSGDKRDRDINIKKVEPQKLGKMIDTYAATGDFRRAFAHIYDDVVFDKIEIYDISIS